jgi:uncharacterized protein (DUF2345 family)
VKTIRVTFVLISGLILLLNAPGQQTSGDLFRVPGEARANLSAAVQQGSWKEMAQLRTAGGEKEDGFGDSVAISGDTVVVGAPGSNQTGAAYVYVRRGGELRNAIQTAKLTASDGKALDNFGASVSISGDTVVVGAPQSPPSEGKAYIFVKPPTGWKNMTETAKLVRTQGGPFGQSVSISGNTAVIGSGPVAQVYVKPPGGWADMKPTATLTASDGGAPGFSVSISGNEILSGDPNNNDLRGAAYLFVEPASGWVDMTQTAKLMPSKLGGGMGASVGISGGTAEAGAPGQFYDTFVCVFVKPTGGWMDGTETADLTGYSGRKLFAYSTAISGAEILVGPAAAQTQ